MIMVVDDDADMAEHCSMLLESYGYAVQTACGGAEARQSPNLHQVKLFILDCIMPGMSGVELSRRMNSRVDCPSIPVLLMSSSLECQAGDKNSSNGFIRKPFLAEELLKQVRCLVGHSDNRASTQ